MYLEHYGLTQPPFGITPNPAFFYKGGKRGEILEALVYAVTHGEGIVKVTGEVGSGKTMLCRMLEQRLPDNVHVIYLINPTLGREEVLYAIAGELGLACGGRRADEVIRMLQEDLIRKHASGRRAVLLIEEAQAMPLETLEEIRLFSNLETAHSKLLQIVLFGQPELDESLRLPRMRQLKERITHSFWVPPLDPAAIQEYLLFRLRAAGYRGPDLFAADAIQLVANVSEGITRRISILADKAMLAAFAEGSYGVARGHVEVAARDCDFARLESAPGNVKQKRLLAGAIVSLAALAAAVALFQFGLPFAPENANAPVAPPTPTTVQAKAEVAPAQPTLPDRAQPAPEHAEPSAATDVAGSARGASPTNAGGNVLASSSAASVANVSAPTNASAGVGASEGGVQQHLNRTRAWLEQAGAGPFTAQLTLISAEQPRQVEQFLEKARVAMGDDGLHVYPSRVGGVARFGVTYGSYTSRADALDAIQRLTSLGYRPQLRTVGGLRDEIVRSASGDMWRLSR